MAKKTEDKWKGKPAEGLPDMCFVLVSSMACLVAIRKGESGFHSTDFPAEPAILERYNKALKVTPQQREAMHAGSLFGWNCPAAIPSNYDKDGKLVSSRVDKILPKHKETL
jgi:hypothetical protein